MPQPEQVHPVTAQLSGQLRGGDAPGDAAEDQDDLRGRTTHALQGGPGPGVEDPAAVAALVVEHRGSVAAVDAESVGLAAPGAGQATGMEQADEPGVACVLVHQMVQGKVPGSGPRGDEGDRLTTSRPAAIVKRSGTDPAS
jgi:hypothetical protein